MRDEDFIDYFENIREEPKERQIDLIGRARYNAFAVLNLNILGVMSQMLSYSIVVLAPIITFFAWGYDIWGIAIAIGVGVLVGNRIYKFMYGHLLKKGLDYEFSKNAHNN